MHDAPHSHEPSAKRHRPSTPTVFGAAFVAGAVASFGINSFFDAHVARSRPQVESEPIFVALRSLPQGTPVTVWDVALRDWPRAMLPQSALRAEDSFEGLILRHPLREGQPLLSVQLGPASTGDLSGSALPGVAPTAPAEEAFAAPVPAPAAAHTSPVDRVGTPTAASPAPADALEFFTAVEAAAERFEAPEAAGIAASPTASGTPAVSRPIDANEPPAVVAPRHDPVDAPAIADSPRKKPSLAFSHSGDAQTSNNVSGSPDAASSGGARVPPFADDTFDAVAQTPPSADDASTHDATDTTDRGTESRPPVVPGPVAANLPPALETRADAAPTMVLAGSGPHGAATASPTVLDERDSPEEPGSSTVARGPELPGVPVAPLAPTEAVTGAMATPARTTRTVPESEVPALLPDSSVSPDTPTSLIAELFGDGFMAEQKPTSPPPNVPIVITAPEAETGSVRASPVQPLPPVLSTATRTRPPVPPAPGSDIEGALAVVSRQRAAQTAANRPGSVIASPDPHHEESLPVPVTPTTDVARSLEILAAAQPGSQAVARATADAAAHGSRGAADDVTRSVSTGEPLPADGANSPDAGPSGHAAAKPPAAHGPVGTTPVGTTPVGTTPVATTPVATTPVATTPPTGSLSQAAEQASPAPPQEATDDAVTTAITATPPLRHLVVPERIALQADNSFVLPRAAEGDTDTTAPPSASASTTPAASGAANREQDARTPGDTGASGSKATPRTERPKPGTQTRPEPPTRTGGPVMRAIGSMFQGFVAQPSAEPTRRR